MAYPNTALPQSIESLLLFVPNHAERHPSWGWNRRRPLMIYIWSFLRFCLIVQDKQPGHVPGVTRFWASVLPLQKILFSKPHRFLTDAIRQTSHSTISQKHVPRWLIAGAVRNKVAQPLFHTTRNLAKNGIGPSYQLYVICLWYSPRDTSSSH